MRQLTVQLCLLLLVAPAAVWATTRPQDVPTEAKIEQRLNAQIDLDLPFVDQTGAPTTLRKAMLPDRPAIITPVYYMCPSLCTYTLNGTVALLNELDLKLGKDFSILSYTINPAETPDLAQSKAENYYKELHNPESGRAGWRFLTGPEASIEKLSTSLGFSFKRDGKDYLHGASIMVITPDGRISRYLPGID